MAVDTNVNQEPFKEENVYHKEENKPTVAPNSTAQSAPHPNVLHPSLKLKKNEKVPNPEELDIKEELPGWHGYIEWEKYPERKKKVKNYMKKFKFPPVSRSIVLTFLAVSAKPS